MTVLASLSLPQLKHRLSGPGLVLRTGPFHVRIRTPLTSVAAMIATLYPQYALGGDDVFVDFDIRLDPGGGLRRCFRRQVRFIHEGFEPFQPLPVDHAPPMLEWAMNWCISTQAHQYLMLHAAVLERGGRALVLPAPPGSGKSTLCAALACRGWRLLSDELTLVCLRDGRIWPLSRPVSLKNESIAVIRNFEPAAVFGLPTHGTSKGTVTHMRVSSDHLARIDEPARPAWLVFPRYLAGAPATLSPRGRADSMLEVGRNAFNYSLLGRTGFEALADLVAASQCYDFSYGHLDDAVATFDDLFAHAAHG